MADTDREEKRAIGEVRGEVRGEGGREGGREKSERETNEKRTEERERGMMMARHKDRGIAAIFTT